MIDRIENNMDQSVGFVERAVAAKAFPRPYKWTRLTLNLSLHLCKRRP